MLEGRTGRVHVQDCSRDAFMIVLQLLYTGAAEINSADPVLLFHVGRVLERYELTSMAQATWQQALDKVKESNILDMIEAAYRAGQKVFKSQLLEKLIFSDMRGVLEGDAGERASPEVVLEIARACLSQKVMWNAAPRIVRTWGHMASEKKLTVTDKRKAEERELSTLTLQAAHSGWNVVMLKPPNTNRFSLRGTTAAGNRNKVQLWVCEGRYATQDVEIAEVLGFWFPAQTHVAKKQHVHLTFTSDPAPHAQLFCNNMLVHEQTFPNSDLELHPVVCLGDSDTCAEIEIR